MNEQIVMSAQAEGEAMTASELNQLSDRRDR